MPVFARTSSRYPISCSTLTSPRNRDSLPTMSLMTLVERPAILSSRFISR